MNKKPLTVEEVKEAADQFFPLFEVVKQGMPESSTTEDTLKVMESICTLAQKLRVQKEIESTPFGFNKNQDAE